MNYLIFHGLPQVFHIFHVDGILPSLFLSLLLVFLFEQALLTDAKAAGQNQKDRDDGYGN